MRYYYASSNDSNNNNNTNNSLPRNALNVPTLIDSNNIPYQYGQRLTQAHSQVYGLRMRSENWRHIGNDTTACTGHFCGHTEATRCPVIVIADCGTKHSLRVSNQVQDRVCLCTRKKLAGLHISSVVIITAEQVSK